MNDKILARFESYTQAVGSDDEEDVSEEQKLGVLDSLREMLRRKGRHLEPEDEPLKAVG